MWLYYPLVPTSLEKKRMTVPDSRAESYSCCRSGEEGIESGENREYSGQHRYSKSRSVSVALARVDQGDECPPG